MKIASPGSLQSVLVKKETTWGTAVTPDVDMGLIVDTSDSTTREVIEIQGLGSIEVQQIVTGNISAAGSMTIQLQHGRPFEYILGAVAHNDTSGDWVHTFTIADVPPSFTLESGENNTSESALTYEGCLCIGAEISIALSGILTMKFDWAGEVPRSTGTAITPILDNLPVFPQSLIDVKVSGVSATLVQSAFIRFTKTFSAVHGIKSNTIQIGFATDLKIEFGAVLGFSGVTLQEVGLGGVTTP